MKQLPVCLSIWLKRLLTAPFEEQYGQIVGWISKAPVPRQLGRCSQLEKSKTIIRLLSCWL
jgi:hypothetical protein